MLLGLGDTKSIPVSPSRAVDIIPKSELWKLSVVRLLRDRLQDPSSESWGPGRVIVGSLLNLPRNLTRFSSGIETRSGGWVNEWSSGTLTERNKVFISSCPCWSAKFRGVQP
ncbi:hypothetical protein HanIR_Chr07g0329071 [Helianthus annuus]|nr:hypothetical protein HanIR_Chr07g0329071 [Helianthus annuus]